MMHCAAPSQNPNQSLLVSVSSSELAGVTTCRNDFFLSACPCNPSFFVSVQRYGESRLQVAAGSFLEVVSGTCAGVLTQTTSGPLIQVKKQVNAQAQV